MQESGRCPVIEQNLEGRSSATMRLLSTPIPSEEVVEVVQVLEDRLLYA